MDLLYKNRVICRFGLLSSFKLHAYCKHIYLVLKCAGSNLLSIRSHYIGLLFLLQAGLIQDKTGRQPGLTSILAPSVGFVF
jgi:hypothetical protein